MNSSKHDLYAILLPALLFSFPSAAQSSQIFYGSGNQTGGFQVLNPLGMLRFNSPATSVMHENTIDRSVYQDLPVSQGAGYVELFSSVALAELNHSSGWFFEAQVNAIQNTNTAGSWDDYYGVTIGAADDLVTVAISLFSNGLRITGNSVYDVLGTYSYIEPGYHTIRFESPANSMTGHLYVDTIQVLNVAMNAKPFFDVPRFGFGDGSSNSDGEAYWKYAALNIAPAVPEPATYVLICMGLLTIARRSRKRG